MKSVDQILAEIDRQIATIPDSLNLIDTARLVIYEELKKFITSGEKLYKCGRCYSYGPFQTICKNCGII